MKKNWMLLWGMLIAVIAILFFSGIGIFYSGFPDGIQNPEKIIVSCLLSLTGCLILIGAFSCAYQAGKGKNIRIDQLRQDFFRFMGQSIARDGNAYATIEDGNQQVFTVWLPRLVKGVKEDSLVRPATINGERILVSADYQKSKPTSEIMPEAPAKPKRQLVKQEPIAKSVFTPEQAKAAAKVKPKDNSDKGDKPKDENSENTK